MRRSLVLFAVLFASVAGAQTPTQTANFALTWVDNSGNNPSVNDQEDGFYIERRLGQSGSFSRVGSVGQNITKFADSIAADPGNTEYCYRVQGFNKMGAGAFSNIACATTPLVNVAPPGPSNVSVTVTVTVTVGQ